MKIFSLKKDDHLIEKLTKAIDEAKINSGLIVGIGALSEVELMVYRLESKSYLSKKLSGALEIGSFNAVIAKDPEGKTHLHPHIVVSNEDFITFAGHVKEATVAATFEAVVLEDSELIERYHDREIGLNLIK